MKTILCAICILFLLHAGHVESRRHRGDDDRHSHDDDRHHRDDDDRRQQPYTLFVFGDNFVSNGNPVKADLIFWTRDWYRPYGVSNSNRATGRFSDGKVQSDFVANLLGHEESPPSENIPQGNDLSGLNFAVSFSNANGDGTDNLNSQIAELKDLVDHNLIIMTAGPSVALVAYSGFDYTDIPNKKADYEGFVNYINDVVDSIASGVQDLLDMGVTKVLVNMMQPMGCSPRYTRTTTNYTECIDDDGITDMHNKKLKDKLGSKKWVLLLDLHEAFTKIIHPKTGTGFLHRHIPCCESNQVGGYCGQVNRVGVRQYAVCENPEDYFYFDEWHPTEAGWNAVMEELNDDIKEFLDI